MMEFIPLSCLRTQDITAFIQDTGWEDYALRAKVFSKQGQQLQQQSILSIAARVEWRYCLSS
jgi:hypothetical protein